MVGSPRSTDPALAPQYLPETLPKVGVTEGIAEWIHGRVYIAQPVAWKHTSKHKLITMTYVVLSYKTNETIQETEKHIYVYDYKLRQGKRKYGS